MPPIRLSIWTRIAVVLAPHRPVRPVLRLLAALLAVLVIAGAPAAAQDEPDTPTSTEQPAGPGLPPSSAPPAGSEEREAGWAVQPAGPDGPGLRSAFTYNMTPGQTIRDSVSISNLSSEEITFAIYAKDAFNTEVDGAFALLDDAEENVDVGSWVTIRVDEYAVPAGKRADIPFELTVPEDAAPGDHAGGIIAANVDVIDEVEQDGITLAVRQRIAARIYVRVAGPLSPELRIKDVSVSSETPLLPFVQGGGSVTYTVENVGNVRLTAATESKVTGAFGRTVASPESQDLPELLPGGSVQITESWDGSPPLEYLTAKISVRSLDTEVAERASVGFFVWSWLVVILLLVAVALVAWRLWRKRRGAAAGAAPDASDADEPVGAGTGGDGA
jgi:cbb3-type cytochrome oxidase subunit 3